MCEYNLGDHSRSDLIIDLRHPDIAIVCTRTYRSSKFQYWVVERCNTTHIEDDDYIIIAPKRLVELSAEGRVLSHCVGSYIDSVSQGLEYILFFREKSDPDKPYFTVDVSKDIKVRQIHEKYNCNVPKELMPLFKEWAEKVQVDITNTNGIYGALR